MSHTEFYKLKFSCHGSKRIKNINWIRRKFQRLIFHALLCSTIIIHPLADFSLNLNFIWIQVAPLSLKMNKKKKVFFVYPDILDFLTEMKKQFSLVDSDSNWILRKEKKSRKNTLIRKQRVHCPLLWLQFIENKNHFFSIHYNYAYFILTLDYRENLSQSLWVVHNRYGISHFKSDIKSLKVLIGGVFYQISPIIFHNT